MIGASIEYAVHQETREVGLKTASADSRNAILHALDNLRMPSRLSKRDLVSTFNATFRIILADTLDLSPSDSPELAVDECELDALDSLGARLGERQIIHRVSDAGMMRSVSQVIKEVLDHDGPSDQFGSPRPGLYVFNCPYCHLSGASQLRAANIQLPVCCKLYHCDSETQLSPTAEPR